MTKLTELKDPKGPPQSEFDCRPLNIHPRLVQASPEYGRKRTVGTLGLTLEPGGMARFQADLVIPQWLANQVYGLLEALHSSTKDSVRNNRSNWRASRHAALLTADIRLEALVSH